MRGMRGMRGNRGGMDFRNHSGERRDGDSEEPQIIAGPPRGMRGSRGDFGGRGRGGPSHR